MNYKQREYKRLQLLEERDKTSLKLEVLCRGIGQKLIETNGYYTENLRHIIDLCNTHLMKAIEVAEEAEKAYLPFHTRRRSRLYNIRHRKNSYKKSS